MQTHFSLAQLANPDIAEADKILRSCVHCGFCTATCPTYLLLGDERDSPRGRIYLIKQMLEEGRAADATDARHLDRCLSCLSCMTTCPSGVHYMHLVDTARAHVAETFARPIAEVLLRRLLVAILPRPVFFRLALFGARLLRPFAAFAPGRLKALLSLAPAQPPPPSMLDQSNIFPAIGTRKKRVALLAGCAQRVLNPAINDATIRLLTRLGCEVHIAPGAGCCGALTHHMGEENSASAAAKANIAAWGALDGKEPLDAIVINTSGCGTMVKDYGFMFRQDQAWAARAKRISDLAKDISELVSDLDFRPKGALPALRVAYHATCSLQHGQKITLLPKTLLTQAGFDLHEIPEGHICCGSAGTYNLLQPELARRLKARKLANIQAVAPDVIAAGNIGCMVQIASGTPLPVVHTVELLDWASGGPKPSALDQG